MTKTGECYYRDELGDLYLAESFDDGGEVTTKTTMIEKAEIIETETTEGQ